MKNIYITLKNFYTNNLIKQIKTETKSLTIEELVKELGYNIQEIIVFDEINKEYISENNELINNSKLLFINADGQIY